ncbi:TPA: hypothetical protein ACP32N_005006 [Pseudomonas aeruginosa]
MNNIPAHVAIQAPEYVAAKQAIAVSLVVHGWNAASARDMEISCLVARLDVETIVGTKTASLSLEPRSSGFQLVGDYLSEGNNVLSTTWLNVPADMTSEQIAEQIPGFLASVHKKIDQSYARRLHLL